MKKIVLILMVVGVFSAYAMDTKEVYDVLSADIDNISAGAGVDENFYGRVSAMAKGQKDVLFYKDTDTDSTTLFERIAGKLASFDDTIASKQGEVDKAKKKADDAKLKAEGRDGRRWGKNFFLRLAGNKTVHHLAEEAMRELQKKQEELGSLEGVRDILKNMFYELIMILRRDKEFIQDFEGKLQADQEANKDLIDFIHEKFPRIFKPDPVIAPKLVKPVKVVNLLEYKEPSSQELRRAFHFQEIGRHIQDEASRKVSDHAWYNDRWLTLLGQSYGVKIDPLDLPHRDRSGKTLLVYLAEGYRNAMQEYHDTFLDAVEYQASHKAGKFLNKITRIVLKNNVQMHDLKNCLREDVEMYKGLIESLHAIRPSDIPSYQTFMAGGVPMLTRPALSDTQVSAFLAEEIWKYLNDDNLRMVFKKLAACPTLANAKNPEGMFLIHKVAEKYCKRFQAERLRGVRKGEASSADLLALFEALLINGADYESESEHWNYLNNEKGYCYSSLPRPPLRQALIDGKINHSDLNSLAVKVLKDRLKAFEDNKTTYPDDPERCLDWLSEDEKAALVDKQVPGVYVPEPEEVVVDEFEEDSFDDFWDEESFESSEESDEEASIEEEKVEPKKTSNEPRKSFWDSVKGPLKAGVAGFLMTVYLYRTYVHKTPNPLAARNAKRGQRKSAR